MLQQEINLFCAFEKPKPPTTILSWRALIISNMTFAGLLSIFVILDMVDVHALENKRQTLSAAVKNEEQHFIAIKKRFPSIFFSKNVEESVTKMTQEMRTREKILNKLSNNSLFTTDLKVIASIIIPEVWLTTINISKSGDEISLIGHSLSAEKMQAFLSKLSSEEAFPQYALSVKNIQDDTKTEITGDLVFEVNMVKNK